MKSIEKIPEMSINDFDFENVKEKIYRHLLVNNFTLSEISKITGESYRTVLRNARKWDIHFNISEFKAIALLEKNGYSIIKK